MIEWLDANQGVVDLCLTLLFLLTTFVLLRSNLHSNRIAEETLAQMRDERRQERRPYVYFEVEITNRHRIVNLALVNRGRGAARDVRARFDQDLQVSSDKKLGQKAIARPIPFLAPDGGKFTEFADLTHLFFRENADKALTGRIEYRGVDGENYSTPIDVDFRVHSHRGVVFRKELKDVVKAVDDLAREMERKL